MENSKRVVKRKIEDVSFEETIPKKAKLDTDKNGRLKKLSDLLLNLVCQWDSCDFRSDSWGEFNHHLVVGHAVESTSCRWKDCLFDRAPKQLLIQHLSHHGYISRLVSIGQNLVEKNGLRECRKARISGMPESYANYECHWKDCHTKLCVTIYDFLNHFETHVKSSVKGSEDKKFECRWKECQTKYPSRVKLAEHIRTHSGEKVIACPTCFRSFSNATKFGEHRIRQQEKTYDLLRCLQCQKIFHNMRLLKDHARTHTRSQSSRVIKPKEENLETLQGVGIDFEDSPFQLLTADEESEILDLLVSTIPEDPNGGNGSEEDLLLLTKEESELLQSLVQSYDHQE